MSTYFPPLPVLCSSNTDCSVFIECVLHPLCISDCHPFCLGCLCLHPLCLILTVPPKPKLSVTSRMDPCTDSMMISSLSPLNPSPLGWLQCYSSKNAKFGSLSVWTFHLTATALPAQHKERSHWMLGTGYRTQVLWFLFLQQEYDSTFIQHIFWAPIRVLWWRDLIQGKSPGGFPCSPVVETLCRGHGFDPL